jgi:hypothetical protein
MSLSDLEVKIIDLEIKNNELNVENTKLKKKIIELERNMNEEIQKEIFKENKNEIYELKKENLELKEKIKELEIEFLKIKENKKENEIEHKIKLEPDNLNKIKISSSSFSNSDNIADILFKNIHGSHTFEGRKVNFSCSSDGWVRRSMVLKEGIIGGLYEMCDYLL